jgi:hypothetical protein
VKPELESGFAKHRGERAQMKAKLEAIGEAFKSDQFDAKALDVGESGATMARNRVAFLEIVLDAAVPVLTQPQRQALADHIVERSGAAAGGELP